MTRAILLDVFDTVLTVDFERVLDSLALMADLTPPELEAGVQANRRALMTGEMTPAQVFAASYDLAGKPPGDLQQLIAADAALLQAHARVYDDVLPFLLRAREGGVRTAFVSNCAPNAGPLLKILGMSDLVDTVVLSCEVGSVKPEPAIFTAALDRLGICARDALMVDDQSHYLAGAAELGMATHLVDRIAGIGLSLGLIG